MPSGATVVAGTPAAQASNTAFLALNAKKSMNAVWMSVPRTLFEMAWSPRRGG